MKPKLMIAANHDTMLYLDCDCGVCFLNTLEAIIVKKHGRPNKIAPMKVWFVERVYKMRRKFVNCWVEYKDPIVLMDHSSNMEIGLCWYQKGTNNKWIYDLTNPLMVDLDTIIALAFMTYIVDLNAYELHPRDEKDFNEFFNKC